MINDLWYKNAVIYRLSVATYMDANGDGVGDFQGLMRSLDYLQGPGITALWLMPFQPSPCKDDGYDVADYYDPKSKCRDWYVWSPKKPKNADSGVVFPGRHIIFTASTTFNQTSILPIRKCRRKSSRSWVSCCS